MKNPKEEAARWRQTALKTLETAKHLRDRADHRSCVSRAYYAAYQAATSVCILHGDAADFPAGWNNPAHNQLPNLIASNGDLTASVRRKVSNHLRVLRTARESADYRVGVTVDIASVIDAMQMVDVIFRLLGIEDGNS